jgi:hypothetical protein
MSLCYINMHSLFHSFHPHITMLIVDCVGTFDSILISVAMQFVSQPCSNCLPFLTNYLLITNSYQFDVYNILSFKRYVDKCVPCIRYMILHAHTYSMYLFEHLFVFDAYFFCALTRILCMNLHTNTHPMYLFSHLHLFDVWLDLPLGRTYLYF